MALRKEQLVLIGTLALVGWLVSDKLGGTAVRRSRSGSRSLEFAELPMPDVSVALPPADALASGERGRFERDLFTPPRDSEPLPPLDLVAPPLEPLPGLSPPAAWGPAARWMGDWLRRDATPTFVPGLFGAAEDASGELLDGVVASDEAPLEFDAQDAVVAAEDLSPEERAERTEGYKRIYDWIRVGNLKFGQIQGEDRYSLSSRPGDPILFLELVPETGQERFAGSGAILYERERVAEFGFADTAANRIAVRRQDFGASLSPGQLEDALAFADECVRVRLEAPRALAMAEEMYALAEGVADGDPRPRLGLARCYEAGFRFEDAYQLYRTLLSSGAEKDPLVHARLAELYARFRLFHRAEASFEEAMRWGRTHWEAVWSFGRFLLERGRGEEAVAHLEQAMRFEPTSLDTATKRAAMRSDYGSALLSVGRVAEAADLFERARSADPTFPGGVAGLYSTAAIQPQAEVSIDADEEDAGFDVALALGRSLLAQGDFEGARNQLLSAADADPFRAHLAWRSLSWLAEVTGHPEDAMAWIERAYEASPTDTYTLFQRGRLLAAADDIDGAQASFRAALDQELDFADALVGVGELANRRGEHEAAERYYERAVSLDDSLAVVHSMRGFNLLALGDDAGAADSFRAALSKDELPSAAAGLAWCEYLGGNTEEAITQLADLVESRRNAPADDPAKLWAEGQIERIQEHEDKELWRDRFDRSPGSRLMKGWLSEQPVGLEVVIEDGALAIQGQLSGVGLTRVYQSIPAGEFVSFQATITIQNGTRARVGAFLNKETRVRGEWATAAGIAVSRDKEGDSLWREIQAGERDAPWQDLFTTQWATGQAMVVRIELAGTGGDTRATLSVDRQPVLEDVPVPQLGRSTSELRFGVFVEGETGRSAEVRIDDVEVVRRIGR